MLATPTPTLLGHVLTVSDVVAETADAVSISFAVPDELRDRFRYRPGQFLTLGVPSDRAARVARCYSLSSSPGLDSDLVVTVKRAVGGYASNWLCDHARPGLELRILPPSGAFTPQDLTQDLVLAAAGSGITPILSIVRAAMYEGRGHVTLFYASRDAESVIFGEALQELAARHPDRLTVMTWLESERGLPTEDALSTFLASNTDRELFTCGPAPFMDLVVDAASRAGMRHGQIHRERYVSLEGDPFELAAVDDPGLMTARVEIKVDGEEHELDWPESRSLVDVLLGAGIDVPYSCREGTCGSCLSSLVEGQVHMDNPEALEEDDLADGFILACQARPASERLRVVFE